MVETGKNTIVVDVATRWKNRKGSLIMALHDIQDHYGYMPREESMKLAELMGIPLARIYEVITFYHYFKLEKPGLHQISLCMGTACYLKGAPQLLAEIKSLLNVEEGGVTADNLFQLNVVRCLGCCGLAPAVMIDGRVYGRVRKDAVAGILASCQHKEA